ncbi:MFS transporter [Peribacillus muralis]|uniref:MFS transporter n=1 Tax=Peribacillus muralis TaxID=264697 RepID=UPI001F4D90F0|nr:MFS transporter [Peribacillus muralis]MCK1993091.1 MFS transporter [Peribacillus muralis]MCK2013646.1 MFS transporter [Peribacillus muralis]
MKKEGLWTKDFISISVVNFGLMLSMYLLLVTMAPYAIEKYSVSVSTAGLVASIFIIGALMSRLFAGRQIESVGNKKMLMIGIAIYIMMTFFYFIPTNVFALMAIRFLQGIGVGMATTATGTIVGKIIPPHKYGEGIGYFSLSAVLAAAIGPLIGVALIEHINYTSIFVFSLVVGIVSLIISILVDSPAKELMSSNKRFTFSSFIEPKALPISISIFVIALGYSSILSFITAYTAEIDLVEAGSFYFLVYALAIMISRPFTGKLVDLKGGNSVAYPGLILFAIGMFLISQAHTSFVFLIASAFIGLGYGNFQSCTQSLAIKVTPRERIGLATSTYLVFLELGIGFGPFILGCLVPLIGYRGMYLSLAGLIMMGIPIYYLLHGRKDKEVLFSKMT